MSNKKYKHISLAEKIICFYLKQLFPDLEESYRARWLGHMEIDVYIPSLNLAVEYDGQYYHQDLERDIRKNQLLFSQGITVIRLREPKCPLLSDGSYIISTLEPNSNDKSYLEASLIELINYINHLYCLSYILEINIKNDLPLIIQNYNSIFEDEWYGKSNRSRDLKNRQAREEKETRIMTLYNQGLTQAEVAKEIGCSRPTVNRILKKQNITRKQKRIRKIQSLKSKGYTQVRVATILEISVRTVKNYWNVA